jgi:hypothetical protein
MLHLPIASFTFGDGLLTVLELAFMFLWIRIAIGVVFDIFRSHDLSSSPTDAPSLRTKLHEPLPLKRQRPASRALLHTTTRRQHDLLERSGVLRRSLEPTPAQMAQYSVGAHSSHQDAPTCLLDVCSAGSGPGFNSPGAIPRYV